MLLYNHLFPLLPSMCIKHVDTFATPIRPIAIFNIPLLRNGNFVVLLRHYLLAILVKTDTRRRRSVTTAYAGTNTNNLSVNGTADAVLQLKIHLWDGIFGEDRGIRDITNSGRFNHITDGKSLDCLVLWCASTAVGATDGLYMATTLLVASI